MSYQLKDNIKVEVDEILKNYGVPLEDRTLVLEKIDAAVKEVVQEERATFATKIDKVKGEIDHERELVKTEVEKLREEVKGRLSVIEDDTEEAYEQGFDAGFMDGTSRIQIQPSGLHLVLG